MIDQETIVVDVDGSGNGATTSTHPVHGTIKGILVDYTGQSGGTTDTTIATAGKDGHAVTILVLTNNETDGYFIPGKALVDAAGAAFTDDVVELFTVYDYITVTVAGGDEAASGVVVRVIWEC